MLRRTVHATITGWEATQWTWLFRVYYGTVAQRSPQRPYADRTDSLWSFMHCTLLFFLPHKKKRIGTETEETFTVVCSYSSTSLPVKKLDKDLSIFLIFQKEIRPGTDRRHPWSTAEILQNLAASPAMMVSPNHPGTARRKPTDVKAQTDGIHNRCN